MQFSTMLTIQSRRKSHDLAQGRTGNGECKMILTIFFFKKKRTKPANSREGEKKICRSRSRTANEAVPNGKGGGSAKSDGNQVREVLAREEAVPEVRPRLRYREEWERGRAFIVVIY
ncbi:hypothetical protein AAHE18_18G135200 [Arachis hypogaea]